MSTGIAVPNSQGAIVHRFSSDGVAMISGSLSITGSCTPNGDGITHLGTANNRFADIYAVQQTIGAVFETGLKTEGIGKFQTGTILVWGHNRLEICKTKENELVMGIVKNGKDEPIVFGAEPVLVTGKIKIGDFIVTSKKPGHGEKAKRKFLFFFNRDLAGKIIGQALENADGESSLIKCMINKT